VPENCQNPSPRFHRLYLKKSAIKKRNFDDFAIFVFVSSTNLKSRGFKVDAENKEERKKKKVLLIKTLNSLLRRTPEKKKFVSVRPFFLFVGWTWFWYEVPMCKTRFSQSSTMVTPTKSKQYYHQRPQGKFSQSPMTTPPRNYRKSTPSPTSDGFKTPQNPRFSPGSNPKTLASRCASEPIKSKKKQPQQQQQAQVTHRTSPLTFAGAKCLDPPTASSLPRPPTTWTKQETTFSAKQVLSFEDLVQTQKNSQNPDLDPLSQQLKMLLKVQAWRMKKNMNQNREFFLLGWLWLFKNPWRIFSNFGAQRYLWLKLKEKKNFGRSPHLRFKVYW